MEGPAAVLGGELVVFGGFFDTSLDATTRVDAWDPVSDTWSQRAPLPTPVTHAGLAVDGDRVWLAGGFVGQNPGVATDAVHVYDVVLDSWSAGPPLPKAVAGGALVLHGSTLHYYGGVEADRDTNSADHWTLDVDQPTAWLSAAPLPVPRCHFAGAELGGLLYAVGGQLRHDTAPEDLDLVHAYDPALDAWTEVAPLPRPRSHFEPGTFVHAGELWIAGGRDNSVGLEAIADVTVYDPALDAWSPRPPLAEPLIAPVARAVRNELVVVAGGPTPAQPRTDLRRRPIAADLGAALRIDAGGDAYVASDGADWCGDWGALGGIAYANDFVGPIAGTLDDELYRTERNSGPASSVLAYRLPAAPGARRVRAHFAEIFFGAPGGGTGGVGSRLFDVRLQEALLIADHDIYAEVGPAAADVHEWEAWLPTGRVDLSLEAESDRPKLSALEVLEHPGATYAAFCSQEPGARIGFVGSTSIARDELHLTVTGAPPAAPGIFLFSASEASTPLGAGTLCAGGQIYRLGPPGLPDADGSATRQVSVTAPATQAAPFQPGDTRVFQYWHRRGDALLYDLSDALRITFGP